MISQLRRQFIGISVSAVFTVLLVVSVATNFLNYRHIDRLPSEVLSVLADNDGTFPKPDKPTHVPRDFSRETPFSTRYFTVRFSGSEMVTRVDVERISSVTESEAVGFAQQAMAEGKPSGRLDAYKYRLVEGAGETLVIFIDYSRELEMMRSFLVNTLGIASAALLGVFVLVVVFSKQAVKPVVESYEKQKRFITDAGHELKTPLTIINTNTEVLEMTYGESTWSNSIRNQTARMSKLVESLVALTRMDEAKTQVAVETFSLTEAAHTVADSFKLMAENSGKTLKVAVEEGVTYTGEPEALEQLMTLLLDNAVKYALEGSTIEFSIKKRSKKVVIRVENATDAFDSGRHDVLFERFYRVDASRNSQKGGYGIGLSIAKAVVIRHRGQIKALSPDGKSLVVEAVL